MLKTLRIKQFAIIEDLTIEFGPGLNLLTGETGAGKSILVDALGLVTGARADSSKVRTAADRALVEAVFRSPDPEETGAFLDGLGIDADEDGDLVLRREVPAGGGGRVFINGSPATVAVLREVGARTLELHGQHEHQSLLVPEKQQALLDRYGRHESLLAEVARARSEVLEARRQLEHLKSSAKDREVRAETLRERISEIDSVAPEPGERDEIELERNRLRHAGEITGLLDQAVALLYEGEPSASGLASAAASRVARLAELDPSLSELSARIEAAQLELQEAGSALRDSRDRGQFDPGRLEQLENRSAALDRLCARFGADEAAVLEARAAAALELESLEHVDDELQRAGERTAELEAVYARAAAELSEARRKAAGGLTPAAERQLRALALPKASFEVTLAPLRSGELTATVPGQPPLSARGTERVEFRISTNPGEQARPLTKVASGGELSRIMLALHVILEDAADSRALVFDEVDAGVGGASADAVGARLASLARHQQVLCVTHLPQVAAYADHHYHVRKRVIRDRTRVEVRPLSDQDRVDELARMLGGKQVTAASRKNAEELLEAAGGQSCPDSRAG